MLLSEEDIALRSAKYKVIMVLLRWKLEAEAEGKESSSMNKHEKGFYPLFRCCGPQEYYLPCKY